MSIKPTYEELEQRVKELEMEAAENMRAKEELQTIFDVVPVIIFQKDRDGKTIRTTKVFNDTIGLSKEEVVGKTADELFPEHGKDMMRDDQEVMESGKPKLDIIEQYDTPEGARWAQSGKIPLKDKKGNVFGLIGYAADITEQKQTLAVLRKREEDLKTSHKNFETVLNHLDGIVHASDLQTYEVLFANKYAKDIFGDVVGKLQPELTFGKDIIALWIDGMKFELALFNG